MSAAHPEAMKRMVSARAVMLVYEPFWGQLALKLRLVEDPTCETAWTDGQSLGYNPEFVMTQTNRQLVALNAHEVSHCTNGHPWRRGGRDHKQWNKACDRAINPVLREAGFVLPEGALYEFDPSHHGKSAEWIYDRLPKDPAAQGQQGDQGSGGSDEQGGGQGQSQGAGEQQPGAPDQLGEVRDAPSEAQEEAQGEDEGAGVPTEADWQQAVQQAAAAANGQGKLPAGLKRMVQEAVKPRVDPESVLRRFVQEVARDDYAWTRPNRRFLAGGIYLPTLHSVRMGPLAIGLDTSGSIDAVLLAKFAGWIQAVVEDMQPRRVHVFSCDTRVHREDVFEPGDSVVLKPAGGGGTDFRPVFEAVTRLEEAPVAVVYLTDLMGTFPKDPGTPTLWITGDDARLGRAPFGEVVSAG